MQCFKPNAILEKVGNRRFDVMSEHCKDLYRNSGRELDSGVSKLLVIF